MGTERDRAMVEAMVLGGLRRCEVLGLRLLDDERPPEAGTDSVFVVLKGPRRGEPLTAYGLDRS